MTTNAAAPIALLALAGSAIACANCCHTDHTKPLDATNAKMQCVPVVTAAPELPVMAYPAFTGRVPDFELDTQSFQRSNSIPVLNSKPNADKTIYLDFDGHTDTTLWADNFNGGFPLVRPPFDLDGNPSSFSANEQAIIFETWQRMAEDYAPFDVNVSTVEPPVLGFGQAQRVVFDPDYSWFSPAGGVAYLNSINFNDDVATWVFINGTGNGWPKGMAEAGSHEVGHTINLNHQSTYDSFGNKIDEYNPGSGDWAPIMGIGYNATLTTFHDGPNSQGSNSTQLDIQFAVNAFGYRSDDHGAGFATGTALSFAGDDALPEQGRIERMNDIDVFTFTTTSQGDAAFTVSAFTPGPNLDPTLRLFRDDLTLIADSGDPAGYNASITANDLAPGTYALLVESNGDYARLGRYTLTGAIDGGFQPVICPGDANGDSQVTALDISTVLGNFGQTGGSGQPGDVTGDGQVTALDISTVLGNFGNNC